VDRKPNSRRLDTATFSEEDEPEPLSFAPARIRRNSDTPPMRVRREFEVVSTRFRSRGFTAPTSLRTVGENVVQLIRDTSADLRRVALVAPDASDGLRFRGYADSLQRLLDSPIARRYLAQPQTAAELSAYLAEYRAQQQGDDPDTRDVLLKASVTAIHLAPCLSYWRNSPSVPQRVKDMLTAERVYGSILEIARTKKSKWVDRITSRYASVVGDLQKRHEIGIKARNPVLWPWCKYNIIRVTYPWGEQREIDERIRDTIADVKLILALFNTVLDDIADIVQDAALMDVFARIPTAGGEFGVAWSKDHAKLRARLRDIGWGHFEPYFDLAADAWDTSVTKLEEVLGESFEELRPRLAYDVERIMQMMMFSVQLNNDPLKVFRLGAEDLRDTYGGTGVGEILSHNSNREAYFTIDLMCLREFAPDVYAEMVQGGSIDAFRKSATLFQLMHQIGNGVATGARETESDDLTNELFQIANDLLNVREDWSLPDRLRAIRGFPRKDAVLWAFDRKRTARRTYRASLPDSVDREEAAQEHSMLGEEIEQLIELSGAEQNYFEKWLSLSDEVTTILAGRDDIVRVPQLIEGNDLLLVMHLVYKGKI
jgi:hypothetical protein